MESEGKAIIGELKAMAAPPQLVKDTSVAMFLLLGYDEQTAVSFSLHIAPEWWNRIIIRVK